LKEQEAIQELLQGLGASPKPVISNVQRCVGSRRPVQVGRQGSRGDRGISAGSRQPCGRTSLSGSCKVRGHHIAVKISKLRRYRVPIRWVKERFRAWQKLDGGPCPDAQWRRAWQKCVRNNSESDRASSRGERPDRTQGHPFVAPPGGGAITSCFTCTLSQLLLRPWIPELYALSHTEPD
jgi:hypothetical protein